ncbi:ciliogenesis and planar polarity effector 2 isoform X1 [Motacilla alba alba]|uniref:ciliogenesis and planar polarity effector 2 isoform X1 n=1 Tax=Motacilla alba alba TaxID=1094192 RepID=UPI0018D4FCD9|nr:ciliogenesis and planar polarity effector 2 isoform X1 [Motacilla alba alba]
MQGLHREGTDPMEGGQAPHRAVSGWFWGPHGRMLGHGGCFRDPMEDLGALGRVPLGWGQKETRSDPMGEGGLFAVPQVWGPMAEQDWALEPGWLLSPAGRPYLDSILHKNRRRVFGAASARQRWWPGWGGPPRPPPTTRPWGSRPPRDPGYGGGAPGGDSPAVRGHHETLGIEATTLFWPAKPRGSGRPVLFQLHLWDCGDGALRKFEHLLPACKEEADAALFLFSFTDRASFEELPALMGRVLGPGDRHLVRVVVGTKFDLAPHAAVTEGDVRAFEGAQGLRVLRAGGSAGAGGARPGLARVAPVLDALVEELWRRDQVTAGVTPGDTGDTPT